MSAAVETLATNGDTPEADPELYRDIISQFPLLNAYTQVVVGFKLPSDVDRDGVVAAIQSTFDKLKAQVPWTGWQVARESKPGGILKAMPWPADVPEEALRQDDYCVGRNWSKLVRPRLSRCSERPHHAEFSVSAATAPDAWQEIPPIRQQQH